ncbi:MAG TPA: hypothetical protein PK624_00805 [Spirochaetota bacterium]|nr:hypothetical protein [Spirochaetota bacterium]HOR43318.1 hypothetical protein [Spirochaetota bacterium]HOU85911.1 hypothetical protein [Spirochaetota bacterium]HPK54933.1 hypothetical protein [Spirochaetota bacterium]
MKNFYDGKVYLVFSMVCLAVSVFLFSVSFYSVTKIEPKAANFIALGEKASAGKTDAIDASTQNEMNQNYTEAFNILKSGQMFALYQNFDSNAMTAKKVLSYMENIVKTKGNFPPDTSIYLGTLLERRHSGAMLGRNTGIFFASLSIVSLFFFLNEKRRKASK